VTAKERIAAAARLEGARNAAAVGAARVACLTDAAERVTAVLAPAPEPVLVVGLVRPFVRSAA
jgi:hypothetical protein